jgi:hypothetical protein
MLGNRIDRQTGCTVAEGTAGMKMGGAYLNEIGIVERRRVYAYGMRRNRIPHAESKEPLDDCPMATTGSNAVEPGPRKKQSHEAESSDPGGGSSGNSHC